MALITVRGDRVSKASLPLAPCTKGFVFEATPSPLAFAGRLAYSVTKSTNSSRRTS